MIIKLEKGPSPFSLQFKSLDHLFLGFIFRGGFYHHKNYTQKLNSMLAELGGLLISIMVILFLLNIILCMIGKPLQGLLQISRVFHGFCYLFGISIPKKRISMSGSK